MLSTCFCVRREPPLPVSAEIDTVGGGVVVTFDRLLVSEGVLDVGNWLVRYHEQDWVVTAGICGGRTVGLVVVAGEPALAGDIVNFSPPPFDVVGRNGVAVEAFVNLALTAA